MLNESNGPWLIAVHGGAGYHSTDAVSEKTVRHALRSACTLVVKELNYRRANNITAVERAISSLEDDDCLNAGYGSNLTMDGTVECDASIMDGVNLGFGSVGAVQVIKNPIALARGVMQNSLKPQPLGRVPPLTLVGPGAHAFAESSGLELVDPDMLVSEKARREWQKWKARFDNAGTEQARGASIPGPGTDLINPTSSSSSGQSLVEDTVGAVACDTSGALAAGVSSGGLLLKYPGRIGEAAVFGAGVWAHSPADARTGVACSVSGTGEAIIRAAFARTLAEALWSSPPEDTHEILRLKLEAFCEEILGRGEEPNVGVLVVTKESIEDGADSDPEFATTDDHAAPTSTENHAPTNENAAEERGGVKLRLWCAFTTESMAIAYASSETEKPRAMIIRQRTCLREGGKRSLYIAALPLSR